MAKENSENVQDKTVRLIIGILLVLISLPAFFMFSWAGGYGMMGMMYGYNFGFFSVLWLLVIIMLFILGLYLIIHSINR